MLVDGRDRHRRVVEKPHEADFGGALRIGAVVAGAIEHQRARRARACRRRRKRACETPAPAACGRARAQIEIEHLGFDVARRAAQRRQQRRAVAGDQIGQLQPAGTDLRQILIEPIGERGIEIDDVALVIDREEPGRRMIEIIDRVLQHLKHILLPLALGGHVGERPDRQPRIAPAVAERPDLEPQPARRPAPQPGDAHLFLQALAFSCCLEQPVDRLGRVGVADKGALDRPHVVGVGGVDEIEIGGVGIDDVAVVIGDDDAVGGAIDDRFDQGMRGRRRGDAQNAAGESEQREHADGGEHRQKRQDIRFGIAAADQYNGGRGGDQDGGDQQHESDAAAAAAAALRSIADRMAASPGVSAKEVRSIAFVPAPPGMFLRPSGVPTWLRHTAFKQTGLPTAMHS